MHHGRCCYTTTLQTDWCIRTPYQALLRHVYHLQYIDRENLSWIYSKIYTSPTYPSIETTSPTWHFLHVPVEQFSNLLRLFDTLTYPGQQMPGEQPHGGRCDPYLKCLKASRQETFDFYVVIEAKSKDFVDIRKLYCLRSMRTYNMFMIYNHQNNPGTSHQQTRNTTRTTWTPETVETSCSLRSSPGHPSSSRPTRTHSATTSRSGAFRANVSLAQTKEGVFEREVPTIGLKNQKVHIYLL